jgi:hypothetical protein
MSSEKMTKEKFPSEQTIIGFFKAGGKGTKREVAEALSIPPNEGPTTRWRDKLDSILRRLHKRGVLKRQQVRKSSRQLYEYSLNTEVATPVENQSITEKGAQQDKPI